MAMCLGDEQHEFVSSLLLLCRCLLPFSSSCFPEAGEEDEKMDTTGNHVAAKGA